MLGLGSAERSDVSTDTSGHQDEYFDQQANSTDIRWTVNDTFSIKYIFGYTDYFYDRTSDVDLTSNTDAFTSYSGDEQFYVSQETEYISHELQFFNDWNDRLTIDDRLVLLQGRTSRSAATTTTRTRTVATRQGFNYAPNTVGAACVHRRVPAGRPVHREARKACMRAESALSSPNPAAAYRWTARA